MNLDLLRRIQEILDCADRGWDQRRRQHADITGYKETIIRDRKSRGFQRIEVTYEVVFYEPLTVKRPKKPKKKGALKGAVEKQ